MKTRSKEKGGGGKSARKAQSQARSNGELSASSVPLSAAVIQDLTMERQRLLDALRYTLDCYERAAGNVQVGHGWTAADILRLQEIRELVRPVFYVRPVI